MLITPNNDGAPKKHLKREPSRPTLRQRIPDNPVYDIVRCYNCHEEVLPVISEENEVTGYIGVGVPSIHATVLRPTTKGKFVARCPVCNAPMKSRTADLKNQEKEREEDEFLAAVWIIGGIVVVIGVTMMLLSVANKG